MSKSRKKTAKKKSSRLTPGSKEFIRSDEKAITSTEELAILVKMFDSAYHTVKRITQLAAEESVRNELINAILSDLANNVMHAVIRANDAAELRGAEYDPLDFTLLENIVRAIETTDGMINKR